MRPILWGTIWFFIGLVGWVTFSIVGGLEKFTTAKLSPITIFLIYFFGLAFFFSLPIAILIEIVRWIKIKRKLKS